MRSVSVLSAIYSFTMLKTGEQPECFKVLKKQQRRGLEILTILHRALVGAPDWLFLESIQTPSLFE